MAPHITKHKSIQRNRRRSIQDRTVDIRLVKQPLHNFRYDFTTAQAFESSILMHASHMSPTSATSRTFNDLPGELRNEIYVLALKHDKAGLTNNLASCPLPTARALSHVSRLVRTESMAMYYSQRPSCYKLSTENHLDYHLLPWAQTWGALAASNIRTLRLSYGSSLLRQQIRIELDHTTHPVREIIQSHHSRVNDLPSERDVNQLVLSLALKLPGSELMLSSARLIALLRALVPPQDRPSNEAVAYGFATRSAVQKRAMIAKLLR